jgi:hypothetical protein
VNVTNNISFQDAKAKIVAAVKDIGKPISVTEWERKVGDVLVKNLSAPVEKLLFDLVDAQDLSQQHKADFYNSFTYTINTDGITLSFTPKTPLVGALELGAPPRSLEESVLNKNYKISEDNHRYKVIPLQSREAVRGADRFVPKQIITDPSAEEQMLREIVVLNGDKETILPFAELAGTDRDRFFRTSRFVTKVDGKRGSSRVYVATSRGHTADNISRFVTFRTITDNPDKRWRPIPGFPGLRLADQLVTQYTELIKDETNRLIERFT